MAIRRSSRLWLFSILAALVPLAIGCGGNNSAGSKAAAKGEKGSKSGVGTAASDPPKRTFQPVKLESSGDSGSSSAKSGAARPTGTVLEAMQPLQVVLGKWRGVTYKPLDGSVKVEEPEWIWDFRTNENQPALVMKASASPYFTAGRMTFLLDKQEFQFTATDKEGAEHVYQGTFTEPVQDVPGDDKKLQRKYKLTLKQVQPADERKLVQVVFAQQENNRYLMEVYDKRGEGALLVNTVANQREGTSFAVNPDDYGEKKCVVSGGLGTSTVSHKGKTYYVCCSGCKAAFEDDPERWIAKFEASKKMNKE